jgi:hypothetical protein
MTEPEIHSADVPQEDNLGDVRRTLEAIVQGLHDTQSIATKTQRSARHASYAINSAIILQFVGEPDDENADGLVIHPLGSMLLATVPGSEAERKVLRSAVEKSPSLKLLVPNFFEGEEPDRRTIAASIMKFAGLAESTSIRRAATLIAWRRQILNQL